MRYRHWAIIKLSSCTLYTKRCSIVILRDQYTLFEKVSNPYNYSYFTVSGHWEQEKAYFIIECKRLDGNKTLNDKYKNEGINRFITKKYSSYYGANGMIGFVVKKIDIDENIKKIGSFLNK